MGLSHKSLGVIARNPACHYRINMAGREVTKPDCCQAGDLDKTDLILRMSRFLGFRP